MDKNQKNFYEVVGIEGGEIIMLDYVFHHSDNFRGATGSRFIPISKAEYEYRTSKNGLIDRLGECWIEAVKSGNTEMGKDDWCQYVYDTDGDDSIFDLSYCQHWDKLRALGYSEKEYPVFECTGGGRCFTKDMKFDKVINQELINLINTYEK